MRPIRAAVAVLFLLAVVCFGLGEPARADGLGWTSQTVASTRLNAIAFAPDGTAWIVGDGGEILTLADGTAWTPDESISLGASLRGVTVTDANTVLVVGTGGTLLRRTVGGSWEDLTTTAALGSALYGIAVSGGFLWTVGAYNDVRGTAIFFSLDGESWNTGHSVAADMFGISVAPDGTFYAVGSNGTILRRSGGWAPLFVYGTDLYGVSAPDAKVAWAVGLDGLVIRTTNGTNWSATTRPTSDTLFAVSARSASDAWVVSRTGGIYRTFDGGATWKAQATGVSTTLRAIVMRSATDGWAVGDGGLILNTTTGGDDPADTPTSTSTPLPSDTPTGTPVPTATDTPMPTPSPSFTVTPIPSWTATPAQASTPTPSLTATRTPTPTATESPRTPRAPTAAVSGARVTVSWSVPADTSLVRYEVSRYRDGASAAEETIQVSSSSTQVFYEGTIAVGTYTFTVTAVYGISSPQRFESAHSAPVVVASTPTPSATPTPTATPPRTITPSPTRTPTRTPGPASPTPAAQPSVSPTFSPTGTRTVLIVATATVTPTPSRTPTPTQSPSPTETPTPTPSPSPTETPTTTPSPSFAATPSSTPSPASTVTPPTPSPSSTMTPSPSTTSTPTPWLTPAASVPTVAPIVLTAVPTTVPTPNPATGGTAALVPTAEASAGPVLALITPAPGAPFQYELQVQLGPTPIGVAVQPQTELPGGVPMPPDTLVSKVVAIDVFDPVTGQIVHDHPVPLRLTLQLDELDRAVCAVDPSRVAVLHVSAAGRVTRLTPTSVDCAAGVIAVELRSTSRIAVALLPNGGAIPYSLYLPLQPRQDGFG